MFLFSGYLERFLCVIFFLWSFVCFAFIVKYFLYYLPIYRLVSYLLFWPIRNNMSRCLALWFIAFYSFFSSEWNKHHPHKQYHRFSNLRSSPFWCSFVSKLQCLTMTRRHRNVCTNYELRCFWFSTWVSCVVYAGNSKYFQQIMSENISSIDSWWKQTYRQLFY